MRPGQEIFHVVFFAFRDDLEDPGSGAWVAARTAGPTKGWFWPQNPNDSPGWDGTWASSGKTNFYAPNRGSRSDATMRMTQAVVLPAKAICSSPSVQDTLASSVPGCDQKPSPIWGRIGSPPRSLRRRRAIRSRPSA